MCYYACGVMLTPFFNRIPSPFKTIFEYKWRLEFSLENVPLKGNHLEDWGKKAHGRQPLKGDLMSLRRVVLNHQWPCNTDIIRWRIYAVLKDDDGFKQKVEDQFETSLLSRNNCYFLNPVITTERRIVRYRV